MKTQNRTRQSNITVNSTTSHPPPQKPFFLLLNTLNKEFSTTDYCVTLYKDIAIASPWGPWVLSRYLDWKTWIWSQSSSRAVVVDPRPKCRLIAAYLQSVYCRVYCEYSLSILGVFSSLPPSPPQKKTKNRYTQRQVKSALTWSCPAPLVCDIAVALWSLCFIFSTEDQFGFRIVLVHFFCPIFSLPPPPPLQYIIVVVAELVFFWGMYKRTSFKSWSSLTSSLESLNADWAH